MSEIKPKSQWREKRPSGRMAKVIAIVEDDEYGESLVLVRLASGTVEFPYVYLKEFFTEMYEPTEQEPQVGDVWEIQDEERCRVEVVAPPRRNWRGVSEIVTYWRGTGYATMRAEELARDGKYIGKSGEV